MRINTVKQREWVVFFLVVLMSWGVDFNLNAQQYARSLPAQAKTYPFFNSDFIRQKRIKTIKTEVMYKYPMQKISFSAESMRYSFSGNGDVEQWISINRSGNEKRVNYYLSKDGKLVSEHIRTSKRNILKSYVYDSHGNVIEIERIDESQQEKFDPERFSYEYYSDTQYKKFWLNNEGLTFKYTIVNLEDGIIVNETTRYIRGASKESVYYHYESGKLISYAKNSKLNTRREVKFELEYDESGMLQVMKEYHDGALVHRFEYLYEEGLVSVVLRKEIKSHQIQITKYSYTFYR
ncbi:hypothetical protein KFE94_05980 [bacterium SCSIO 12643]|nr:hypothetical protein KFE94_05980 [bacterium SCSIO 12643]